MKTFRVFLHPSVGFDAVKVGFSWPALFFPLIWPFLKRLWLQGFAIFLVVILLEVVFRKQLSTGSVLPWLSLLAELCVSIAVGYRGNDWRVSNLKKRGFELVDTLDARTPDAAIDLVQANRVNVKGVKLH